jgi:hypothetical protein
VLPLTAITHHEGGQGEAETATPPARHLADQGIYADIVSQPEAQTLAASDLVADSNELSVPGGSRRIQSAHIVQHADSLSEQIVYRTMWDAGKAETSYEDGQPRTELVQLGWTQISRKTNLALSTCQQAVKNLGLKRSLEVIDRGVSETRKATVYRVYCYTEILRRRKEAGLVLYVRKPGGGRAFVTVTGVEIDLTQFNTAPNDCDRPLPKFGTVPNFSAGTPPKSECETLPNLGRQLERFVRKEDQETTSLLDPIEIARVFRQHESTADQKVVAELIRECLAQVPNLQTEEIVAAIGFKGAKTAEKRLSVDFPAKYLKAAVVLHFKASTPQKRRSRISAIVQSNETNITQSSASAEYELAETPADNPWHSIQNVLSNTISLHTYEIWFAHLRYINLAGGVLELQVPAEHFVAACKMYEPTIIAGAKSLALAVAHVNFLTKAQAAQSIRNAREARETHLLTAEEQDLPPIIDRSDYNNGSAAG